MLLHKEGRRYGADGVHLERAGLDKSGRLKWRVRKNV